MIHASEVREVEYVFQFCLRCLRNPTRLVRSKTFYTHSKDFVMGFTNDTKKELASRRSTIMLFNFLLCTFLKINLRN